jgi:hypothetical protein
MKELDVKMKTWPGRMSLVMESTTSKEVSSKVLLCCIKNLGSTLTLLDEPYQARFVDDLVNLLSRPVDCPEIISKYFQRSNGIGKCNQARQFT